MSFWDRFGVLALLVVTLLFLVGREVVRQNWQIDFVNKVVIYKGGIGNGGR